MSADQGNEPYQEGRRHGLAIAAIACSTLAFVSMLGIEKAILALVLATLAVRGSSRSTANRGLALLAGGISIIYVITFVVVLVVFHGKLTQLLHLLQQMS